jgi:hypothetical protein
MRRIARGFLAVAALAVCSACSDSSGPKTSSAWVGSYTLISINGQNLPAVLFANQLVTFTITSGSVTLNSDNSFSTTGTVQQTPIIGQTTTITETCTGTYAMSGNTITFTESGSASSNCGGSYNGTWDGSNSVTVALDVGVQALFRK